MQDLFAENDLQSEEEIKLLAAGKRREKTRITKKQKQKAKKQKI